MSKLVKGNIRYRRVDGPNLNVERFVFTYKGKSNQINLKSRLRQNFYDYAYLNFRNIKLSLKVTLFLSLYFYKNVLIQNKYKFIEPMKIEGKSSFFYILFEICILISVKKNN